MPAIRLLSVCFGAAAASGGFLKLRDSLPDVDSILRKPTDTLQELTSKVSVLSNQITAVQEEGEEAVKKDKAKYEATLEQQRNENHVLARENLKLDSDIKAIRRENQMLRDNATKLKQDCAHINADLKRMLANISTAQEFTSQAMDESARLLGNASELAVIRSLDEQEKKAALIRLHDNHLSEVGKLSFLQVDSKKGDVAPEALVESLGSALADLQSNLNASRASLKESFLREWKDGEQRRQSLLSDQEQKNKSKASALALRDKLIDAVQHLQHTRKTLRDNDAAVKNFAKLLGTGVDAIPENKNAIPEKKSAAMLLQLGQEQHIKALPEVDEVLSKPKEVMDSLSSQVNSLQKRLAQVNQVGTTAIAAQKADYDEQLETQRKRIASLSNKNKDTSARIDSLKHSNYLLRSKARLLTKQGASLTSELQSLKTNVSTAQEFIDNALSSSVDLLLKSPQLQILADLDVKDAEDAKTRAHETRLREVKSSFLQTRADPAKPAESSGAQSILDSLSSALDDLAKEQKVSEASLKEAFETEFHAGEARQNKLLQEKAELEAAEAAELKLQEDLTAATNHLSKANAQLLQQSQGLKQYMQHLGSPSSTELK